MPLVAIYPGSFDPPTNGHMSIIHRGLQIFDKLIVAVANSGQKTALFNVTERMELMREAVGNDPRVELDTFQGLTVDYARKRKIFVILRGLRAVSDFEYEFQLANMNRKLEPSLDTLFMMTGEDSFYIASKFVREVATLGGDVSSMVPPNVRDRLVQRFGKKKS